MKTTIRLYKFKVKNPNNYNWKMLSDRCLLDKEINIYDIFSKQFISYNLTYSGSRRMVNAFDYMPTYKQIKLKNMTFLISDTIVGESGVRISSRVTQITLMDYILLLPLYCLICKLIYIRKKITNKIKRRLRNGLWKSSRHKDLQR